VTLPEDVAAEDRFEVLFGSKGPDKRTLRFTYGEVSGSLAEVREQPYEWLEFPLGKLEPGSHVVLFGREQQGVAFIAGVRLLGNATAPLTVNPVRTAQISTDGGDALVWADLPGFEMSGEVNTLWDPSPN